MSTAWAIAITLVGWLGHAFGWTVLLNFVYSFPIHRKLQRGSRLFVGLIVFAFPFFAFPFLYWLRFHDIAWWQSGGIGYLAGCVTIAGVIVPFVTSLRAFRTDPVAIIQRQSFVVDIGKESATQLLGRGKHWRLARLPGNQLLQVEFTELTLQLPRLPATWHDLTMLHLSDLHFHGTPTREFFEKLIERVQAWGAPDVVCITGDLVDTVEHESWIEPLLGQLQGREAKLAILGNHDYWTDPPGVRCELSRAGYTVLGNTWVALRVRGEPLIAIGHEGPWFRPGPDLRNAPADGFRLLLSHTPDNVQWARQQHVDLMLSGHVHGGQVRVPVLGALFVPSRHSRRYDQGVFWEPPTLLSVTRGISGREPLRWNCRPEVNWYRLVAAANS